MISFKQYLIESRSAPLYHAAPLDWAVQIIKQGHFTSNTLQPGIGRRGLSTSRDIRFPYAFISYRYNHFPVIFELDQQRLSQRYKVKPIDYFGSAEVVKSLQRSQSEEFIIFDGRLPLNPYVRAIWIGRDDADSIREMYPREWKILTSSKLFRGSNRYMYD